MQYKIIMSKKLLIFIAAVSILTSCYNCIEDEATDKYYLIEVLLDPGDGSGIFEPVESEKFIELHQDGTVTSNGEICGFGVESNSATAGTFAFDTNTISTPYCIDLSFELVENELIIDYPCIEPCRAKFLK